MMLKKVIVGLIGVISLATLSAVQGQTNPKSYAVEVSATVQTAPPQILLRWPADANATGYTVSSRSSATASWTTLGTLPGTATTFTDQNVAVGGAYEYQITKSTSIGYRGTGYIFAGIERSLVDYHGKVILVVENTFSSQLASELARLEQDLTGDGWVVVRRDVNRNDSVVSVKNVIKKEYDADPTQVRAVFLFGRVPVSYSGNFNPDAHPDHQGAWPADAYYGDMDGNWTDTTVNNTSAARAANRNVPGDGKFDQSDLPSDVELAVGRVDFANMTCFSNKTPARSELDLLRQYLQKDHNFRHGRLSVARRGLVSDNFGERNGEAFAVSGWRNFAPMFGADTTVAVGHGNFFPTLRTEGYLWAYGTGGGSYTTCNGVGGSDDFAVNDVQAVFTMFLGSYFGDWDNESNFLRAALGSTTYTLTTSWAGRPHWFYHHMGLGEPIATSTRLSQNNRYGGAYAAQNFGTRQVHVALLGDPTLRMHPVLPPANVSGTSSSTGVSLSWSPSADRSILGYHVYRAASSGGAFTRISGNSAVSGTSFNDATGTGSNRYMVRAIKMEQSGSGSYLNPSQGMFAVITAAAPQPSPEPTPSPTPVAETTNTVPTAPSQLSAAIMSPNQIRLRWNDNSTDETGFAILRKVGPEGTYVVFRKLASNVTEWTDVGVTEGVTYYYRVRAFNTVGNSTQSNQMIVNTSSELSGTAPLAPSNLTASISSSGGINLAWSDNSRDETTFLIIRSVDQTGSYATLKQLTANTTRFTDTNVTNGVVYSYRVRAVNSWGNSAYSAIARATNNVSTEPANGATFVSRDSSTGGSWTGVYGADGYNIVNFVANYPTYAKVSTTGALSWTWVWSTGDGAAVQKPGAADRLAACWYSSSSFNVNVSLNEGQTRRVALYCLDWDRAGRQQTVEVIDTATGAVLNSQTVSGFDRGVYLVYDLRGNVTFRVTRTAGPNAVVSALLFR